MANALAQEGALKDVQLEITFCEAPPMCAHNAVWADIFETLFDRTIKVCNNGTCGTLPFLYLTLTS